MSERYVAKQHEVVGDMFWSVFDDLTKSFPAILGGRRVPYMSQDEDLVHRAAKALNDGEQVPLR